MASVTSDRVDGLTTDVTMKAACRLASTANLTLSAAQTIDSVSAVAEDRVLVKDQNTDTENGIYIVKSGAWVRARDFNGPRDFVQGTLVLVNYGTTHALGLFRVSSTADPHVVDTSSIAFTLADTLT